MCYAAQLMLEQIFLENPKPDVKKDDHQDAVIQIYNFHAFDHIMVTLPNGVCIPKLLQIIGDIIYHSDIMACANSDTAHLVYGNASDCYSRQQTEKSLDKIMKSFISNPTDFSILDQTLECSHDELWRFISQYFGHISQSMVSPAIICKLRSFSVKQWTAADLKKVRKIIASFSQQDQDVFRYTTQLLYDCFYFNELYKMKYYNILDLDSDQLEEYMEHLHARTVYTQLDTHHPGYRGVSRNCVSNFRNNVYRAVELGLYSFEPKSKGALSWKTLCNRVRFLVTQTSRRSSRVDSTTASGPTDAFAHHIPSPLESKTAYIFKKIYAVFAKIWD